MKKIAFFCSLFIFASSVFGTEFPKEWTTETANGKTAYVVLHNTVGVTTSGNEWFVTLNHFENGTFKARARVHVNGCPQHKGKMLILAIADDSVIGGPIDWMSGGDRVFDEIAFNVCKAAYGARLFELLGDIKKPTPKNQFE